MQIFVKGIGGKTTAFDVHPWQNGSALKSLLECREGIPAAELLLTQGGRYLRDTDSLGASEATISLSLRLVGGKGGFGSNLRAAGKKTQIDNFDSCRDLQGRRIRHNTAAQKLEEWQAEAEERELEKVALRHLKQVEKEERRVLQEEVEIDVRSVRVASKKTLAGVQSAVKYGLKQSGGVGSVGGDEEIEETANGDGVVVGEAASSATRVVKKRKMMDALEELSSSSDGGSGSEDEEET